MYEEEPVVEVRGWWPRLQQRASTESKLKKHAGSAHHGTVDANCRGCLELQRKMKEEEDAASALED